MQSIVKGEGDEGGAHRPTRKDQARKRKAIGLAAERPTAKSVLQMPPEEAEGQGRLWLAVFSLVAILLVAFWLLYATVMERPLLPFTVGLPVDLPSIQDQQQQEPLTLLLEDDFSNPRMDLVTESQDGLWQMGFGDDFYEIQVETAGNLVWSTLGVLDLGHYRLESDLTVSALSDSGVNEDGSNEGGSNEGGSSDAPAQTGDPALGYGGLLARFNNAQNFYLFSIDGNGAFQVQLQRQESWQTLQPWLVADSLNPAGELNRLAVEDDGQHLRFYANGDLLYTVDAPLLPSGDVALAGGTRSQGTAQVRFDWLGIYALPTP